MKNIITLLLVMLTMSSYSQMVRTKHGWDYYSKSYFFKEYGEKEIHFPQPSKLSYNEDDNGLMIIYTNGQRETYHLTQVNPIFTSETESGNKYELHEMLNYTTYTGLYLQIIFSEKVVMRVFYPNGFREYSY
jgi:hypothetical protein